MENKINKLDLRVDFFSNAHCNAEHRDSRSYVRFLIKNVLQDKFTLIMFCSLVYMEVGRGSVHVISPTKWVSYSVNSDSQISSR